MPSQLAIEQLHTLRSNTILAHFGLHAMPPARAAVDHYQRNPTTDLTGCPRPNKFASALRLLWCRRLACVNAYLWCRRGAYTTMAMAKLALRRLARLGILGIKHLLAIANRGAGLLFLLTVPRLMCASCLVGAMQYREPGHVCTRQSLQRLLS